MEDHRWTKKLLMLACKEPYHLQCVSECSALEPAYEKLRSSLSPEEQDLLDRYISACEEVQYSLIFLARQLGENY